MARATISSLEAQITEKDAELALLRAALDEAHRRNYELRSAFKLIGLIVQDSQER